MNMKKSIAGVMAGAMAVSAMATTTSAWTGGTADQEQIVLSYDLNEYGLAFEDTVVTVETTYAKSDYSIYGIDAKNDTTVVTFGGKLGAAQSYDLVSVELNAKSHKQADGSYTTDNVLYYSKAVLGASLPSDLSNESVNVDDFKALDVMRDDNNNVYAYKITFAKKAAVASNPGAYGLGGSFIVDGYLTTSGTEYSNVNSYYVKAEIDESYIEDTAAVEMLDKNGTAITTFDDANVLFSTPAQADEFVKAKNTADKGVAVYTVVDKTIGYAVKKTPIKEYKPAGTFYWNEKDGLVADMKDATAYAEEVDAKLVAGSAVLDKAMGNGKATVETVTTGISDTYNRYAFETYTVTKTYYTNNRTWNGDWNYTGDAWMYSDASNGISDMGVGRNVVNVAQGNGVAIAKPMESGINKPADVIAALKTKKDAWSDVFYTSPVTVLNDIVANNENVSFTFTTSASYVDVRDQIPAVAYNATTKKARIKNPAGSVETIDATNAKNIDGTWYVDNIYRGVAYTGNGDGKYTWYNPYFAQHLYHTGTYGNYYFVAQGPNGTQRTYDQFGSYSSDWNTNLFTGGLVINSNWTMQLSDTDAFEWGDQTLTFYWNSIKENKVTNATQFIQTMLLYTPQTWFWDKMDVAVGAAVVEPVAAGAGTEDDGEDVEEVVEEEVIEEEIIEEEPVEEEVEEIEEEVEEPIEEEVEEIVEDVASPVTGNASVALAVIPVALAAAAVVAKKRN